VREGKVKRDQIYAENEAPVSYNLTDRLLKERSHRASSAGASIEEKEKSRGGNRED